MSLHSPSCLLDTSGGDPTVNILYIRRRLGALDYKASRLVRFVSLLVSERGFPPPLPRLIGQQLTHDVTEKSHWLRHAVEAWLDDFLPPDSAMSIDRAAMAAAAAEMDAAAGNLRLIRGGRA
ncbi:hypothetical protein [Novosphingobium colocasiae]|uniref:hypothetical protein n=1 Tax=Novosphingobium colocasiae TaxID=1256513 RepID=UPI0035B479C6